MICPVCDKEVPNISYLSIKDNEVCCSYLCAVFHVTTAFEEPIDLIEYIETILTKEIEA